MLRYILFDTFLLDASDDPSEGRKDLGWLLEALVQRDMDYLVQNPGTQRLYKSGVRYEVPAQHNGMCEEVKILRDALGSKARDSKVASVLAIVQAVLGGERFRDIGRIIERGYHDCDGLAAWRVAELRQQGIQARVLLSWRKPLFGGKAMTLHALVLWPDGTSEDPSLLLGMGGASRVNERAEEIRKNAERCEGDYMARMRAISINSGGANMNDDGLSGALASVVGAEAPENGYDDAFGELQRLFADMKAEGSSGKGEFARLEVVGDSYSEAHDELHQLFLDMKAEGSMAELKRLAA